MTGEQKPGGLSEAWRVLRKTFSDRFEDGYDHEIERMEAAVAAAEAKAQELEALLERANATATRAINKADLVEVQSAHKVSAAEAKLARAMEGLERIRDGGTYFAAVDMRDEARQTLAALQQGTQDQ